MEAFDPPQCTLAAKIKLGKMLYRHHYPVMTNIGTIKSIRDRIGTIKYSTAIVFN